MSDDEQQQEEKKPKGKGKPETMENEPYVAPDGHVVLSQEDIDNRA